MICPKCGNENEKDAKFCMTCGKTLVKKESKVKDVVIETASKFDFKKILNAIINPYKTYKENESNLGDTKKCLIFSGIIILFTTIIKLITVMYSAIKVTGYDWKINKTVTSWVWSNLGDVDYLNVIGKNILIYAGVLLAISGIYYLASLVIKKESSFIKLLGIVNISVIPFILGITIVGPIIGLLSTFVGICIVIISFILSMICFVELVNEEIDIKDKNTKIYFHLVCLSILVIALYYSFTRVFFSLIK